MENNNNKNMHKQLSCCNQKQSAFSLLNLQQYSSVILSLFSTISIAILLLVISKVAFANSELDHNAFINEIENTVEQALTSFNTPGMAVGIVYKNQVILSKGFGLANIQKNKKVNARTYFRLASTSKAFTAAALAILVDEEKIAWEDKVITYLPDFELYDPYVTREFTILDLLTHRSGLLSGAGDSMIWPEPSGFSRQEVIHNLRYLSPEYSFRAHYAYSNVMYITAGELVAKVARVSFDEFVEQRIFKPLGMQCFVGNIPAAPLKNAATAYGHNDTRGLYDIPRNGISKQGQMSAAAGGMVCNVDSMLKWIKALLSKENLPFSEDQLTAMWQPHTILEVSDNEREWDETLFNSYGLGWRLANVGKLKMISHTGTLSGYQAYVALIPHLELGVVILNNGSNSAARGSVMQTIVKTLMQQAGYFANSSEQAQRDWIDTYLNYLDEREQDYLARYEKPVASAPMSISDEQVIGEYKDKWYGSMIVSRALADPASPTENLKSPLRIHSSRMSALQGTLIPFQDATYKIEWDNKNAANDAFMHFSLNVKRQVTSAKLHPFSVKDIINHEYTDMHFIKVEQP